MDEHLLRVHVSCALIHDFIRTDVFALNVLLVCLLRLEVIDESLAEFDVVTALESLNFVELLFLLFNASELKARQESEVDDETHEDHSQHYNLVDLQQFCVAFQHHRSH